MTTPKRIQLSRKKGYRKPTDAVNVARSTKWGNPFTLKDYLFNWHEPSEARRLCLVDFTDWLDEDEPVVYQDKHQYILDHIHELRGKDLACWCKPSDDCHADVLLQMANGSSNGGKPCH